MRYASILCALALSLMAAAQGRALLNEASNEDTTDRYVRVIEDLVAKHPNPEAENALACTASSDERSNNVSLPGIFLHPNNTDDAVLTFPAVPIPDPEEGARPFLLFRIGIRDGVPWDTDERIPNGVRFEIRINDKVAFDEEVTGAGWRPRAIELTPWAGKAVTLQFRTNSIDENSNYDWSVFAEPLIVEVKGRYFQSAGARQLRFGFEVPDLPSDTVGVVLASVAALIGFFIRPSICIIQTFLGGTAFIVGDDGIYT